MKGFVLCQECDAPMLWVEGPTGNLWQHVEPPAEPHHGTAPAPGRRLQWEQTAFDGLEEPLPRKRSRPKGTRKGPQFEQVVADYCETERRTKNGNKDRGDLVLRHWVAEIFCPGRGKPLNLPQKMNEARVEAENAGCPTRYCVIVRRVGKPVEEAFVALPLWMARELGIPE